MSTELIIVLAVLWLASGWLPSRIVKHYMYARYPLRFGYRFAGSSVASLPWGMSDEVISIFGAVTLGVLAGVIQFFRRLRYAERDYRDGWASGILWGFRW